ncbi:spidroin-2-like [Ylistrum balloti]|uniref:spidroin-2-like n=1 Tax=Ylistrum balloti TaxID=509963 RepID=UPI0029057ECC|nr:spidroin-2-like [Ylistrum balloti]
MAEKQVFKTAVLLVVFLLPLSNGFLFKKKPQGANLMGRGPGFNQNLPNMMGPGVGPFQQGPNGMGPSSRPFQQGPNGMGPGPGPFQQGPNGMGPSSMPFQQGPNGMGPGPVPFQHVPNGQGPYSPGQGSLGRFSPQSLYQQGPYPMSTNIYQAWSGANSRPTPMPRIIPPKPSFFKSIGRVFSSLFRFGNAFVPP